MFGFQSGGFQSGTLGDLIDDLQQHEDINKKAEADNNGPLAGSLGATRPVFWQSNRHENHSGYDRLEDIIESRFGGMNLQGVIQARGIIRQAMGFGKEQANALTFDQAADALARGDTPPRNDHPLYRASPLAEQAEESGESKRQEKPADDGPAPPNVVHWKGRSYDLPPTLWRILNHLWSRDVVMIQDLATAVWVDEGSEVPDGTIRARLSELNSRLLEIGIPRSYSIRLGRISST